MVQHRDRRSKEERVGGGGVVVVEGEEGEVICQIGFHSLPGLRAGCQPERLTPADSPPRIGTYSHSPVHATSWSTLANTHTK